MPQNPDARTTAGDSIAARLGYKTLERGKRKLKPLIAERTPLGSQQGPRLAKIAYMIMANGLNEIRNTKRLLKVLKPGFIVSEIVQREIV